eukprot:gene1128-1522_t
MEQRDTVFRRYPPSDTSLPARYARAIATYRHGDLRSAVEQIDALIKVQPANAYFHELRGQALLEGGRPADAVAPLRRAVQLSNGAPLVEMLLGQALVASDNKATTDEAIRILKSAVARESEAPIGYSQLAMAYGRKGDLAEADLASAQASFLRGDNKTARELASRAKARFQIGTPGWVKADDILAERGVLVVPDVICNAGGVTVSYFEWVQDFSSFFWDEDEINVRLDRIMMNALNQIWDTADKHKIPLRTATYAVACERILMARQERGLYP